jgi:hypothetical protein
MVKIDLKNNRQNTKTKNGILGVWMSFFILCFAMPIYAQDVSFKANVDKDRTALNEPVELNLIVTGAQNAGNPELPALDGFEIVSTGSSSQYSFINGQMSASKNFTYILMPVKEGKLTISPAKIDINGKVLETEPINVEVVKGIQGSIPTTGNSAGTPHSTQTQTQVPALTQEGVQDRIFIKVTTDKDTVYIGQQITLVFKLYYRDVRIDNIQYNPPATKGFVTEPMGNQKEYRDVINGITYNVVELKTAVFPAKEGELTIEPAKFKCDVLVREQRGRMRRGGMYDDFFDGFFEDPFFGNYIRYPIDLMSDPVKITVKSLPAENKPDTFKGALGTYDFNAEVSPLSLKAGEPINIVMKVSGVGNISQVSEPVIKKLIGFKTYDSEVKTDITSRDPQITGKKVFQKIIIPHDENVKEIPEIEFSYFDPDENKFNTIKKGPFSIVVAPGIKKEAGIVEMVQERTQDEESKNAIKLLARDIQYIEQSPGRFTKRNVFWYKNIFLWIGIIVLPLLVLGISYMFVVHKTKLQSDKAYAKSVGAGKAMKQLFEEALRYKKENQTKEFYDSIAKALQKYISDKLNIPIGIVTAQALNELLSLKGIKRNNIDDIKNILNLCDLVRFGAHSATQEEVKQTIKDVERIIEILSKKL